MSKEGVTGIAAAGKPACWVDWIRQQARAGLPLAGTEAQALEAELARLEQSRSMANTERIYIRQIGQQGGRWRWQAAHSTLATAKSEVQYEKRRMPGSRWRIIRVDVPTGALVLDGQVKP
jgi:hypothetical protein